VGEASLAAVREGPPERGVAGTFAAIERGAGPVKAFLARFARPDDRAAFLDVAARLRGPDGAAPAEDDLAVLAPAFVVSELRRAFTIGFLVFLPFLVVDLSIASVLLSLGLTQLSPTAVALPFKLLLLVAVDGFGLLVRGLAAGYLP
jgi:type III secretion protein R